MKIRYTYVTLVSNSDCCISVWCSFSMSDGVRSGDRVFIVIHDTASHMITIRLDVTSFNAITLT